MVNMSGRDSEKEMSPYKKEPRLTLETKRRKKCSQVMSEETEAGPQGVESLPGGQEALGSTPSTVYTWCSCLNL